METCWLAREHQIPTPIRKYAARINRRYTKAIADGIVPTQEIPLSTVPKRQGSA